MGEASTPRLTQKIPIVLMPGLDGTGDLFRPLIESCPAEFDPIAIRYPGDRRLTPEELLATAAASLPDTPFVLLGESFSGSLAIRLAAMYPQRVRSLVLCNTFASSPAPSLARFVPWEILMLTAPPTWFVRTFLVGRQAPREVLLHVLLAIAACAPAVLASRLRSVLAVDVREEFRRSRMPVLYLRSTQDRMLRDQSLASLVALRPDVQVARIRGPHLLLQVAPQEAWHEIQDFVRAVAEYADR